MEWMLLPFKRYAEFSGRSRRKEYWMFVLLNIIVYIVLGMIVFSTSSALQTIEAVDPSNPYAAYSIFYSGTGIILGLWWLVVLIPGIAVTVRRLHDRDMSGWWLAGYFVASLIPLLNFIAAIAFLVLMLLDGTPGANRFGLDPKNRADAEVFS